MLISRKRYKIKTFFQRKNGKSYIVYRMTPTPVTLNDLEGRSLVAGISVIHRPFMQHFIKFQITQYVARSLGDSRASCYDLVRLTVKRERLATWSLPGIAKWLAVNFYDMTAGGSMVKLITNPTTVVHYNSSRKRCTAVVTRKLWKYTSYVVHSTVGLLHWVKSIPCYRIVSYFLRFVLGT